MAYQALYRKYRPQRFEEIVGQAHITTILQNQIKQQHASHAYLFCGSRGTGKTSTAKIFARALNCLSPEDGEACGRCDACLAMDESASVDIVEIDAASNNGVDDVRALIEQSRFTPLSLKHKVYIIDEVHMLTGAASNALLKTLEEPPRHVVFLLATTEPQKLLATVISRCQRFDFRRLAVDDIVKTVQSVASHAGAQIDEEGLLAIARAADGGLRDALSLTDQCIAFCGNNISAQDVYSVLGAMDMDFIFNITDALISSNAASAIKLLDEVVQGGRDLGVLVLDLSRHIHALLLAKTCGDCRDLLDCTPETMRRYIKQAEQASEERLLRALNQLAKTQNDMKWLGQPRVLLDTTLVRICRAEDETDLIALKDRLDILEKKLEGAVFAQPSSAPESISYDTTQPTDEDSPPWEETTVPPVATPAKKQAPAVSAPVPQKHPAEKKENTGIVDYWETLKKALQTRNLSLYVIMTYAQSAQLIDNTLFVRFSPAKESSVNMLNNPKNLAILKEELQKLNPELGISISAQSSAEQPPTPKELNDLFGDKLSIVEE
ncbi:DNA polymerase III subunit gamma/tau [Eubacteriales bacterium OttesenSCG-928-K08]|nr:DNA polymerase III subunit gamma/tau [Eubacteriales bacterium OttesenSCG-928-K08]